MTTEDLSVPSTDVTSDKEASVLVDPLFFERLLIKWLFTSESMRERIVPYLSVAVFNTYESKEVVKGIQRFQDKWKTFPTLQEIMVESPDTKVHQFVLDCMKIVDTDFNQTHLQHKVEEFFRSSLLFNSLVDTQMMLRDGKWDELATIPERMRDAISFNFGTTIGLEFTGESAADELYEALHDNQHAISSGLRSLDELTDGGFHNKTLSIFLAATNVGKTLVMGAVALNMLMQGRNILYVTLELSEHKLAQRFMANILGYDIPSLRLLSKDSFRSIFQKFRSQMQQRFFVKEYPTKTFNANDLRVLLKELRIKKKFVPDVVFVDYISIMVPNAMRRDENSYSEVKRISEELRGVGVEFDVPVITAEQVNREGMESATIDLTNTANSIGTAATADVVIGMTQSEEFRTANKYSWIVLKNRFGENRRRIVVGVNRTRMSVYDIEDTSKKPAVPVANVARAAEEIQTVITRTKRKELRDVGLTLEE